MSDRCRNAYTPDWVACSDIVDRANITARQALTFIRLESPGRFSRVPVLVALRFLSAALPLGQGRYKQCSID